jgi:hypothetical protein
MASLRAIEESASRVELSAQWGALLDGAVVA